MFRHYKKVIFISSLIVLLELTIKALIKSDKIGNTLLGCNIKIVDNYGIAYSFFENSTIMSFMPMLQISIIIYLITISRYYVYEVACIIGGGLSNIMERMIHNKVIDYIQCDAYMISNIFHDPVFNTADIFIFIGCMGIIIKGILFR